MINDPSLPDSAIENAKTLEQLLTGRATGYTSVCNITYNKLRNYFLANSKMKSLLPEFVRNHRTLDAFWPYIKKEAGTYADRRYIISNAFNPLMEYLESENQHPCDSKISYTFATFDVEGIHDVWTKALNRRDSDPEGAITTARTLLEAVCKRILDELKTPYTDKEDLPKLYSITSKALNLAPNQHSEEAVKAILSGAIAVVNGLGTLRNKLSDSHARGGTPVKPSERHASLAVNMAGALATFLVETHEKRFNIK